MNLKSSIRRLPPEPPRASRPAGMGPGARLLLARDDRGRVERRRLAAISRWGFAMDGAGRPVGVKDGLIDPSSVAEAARG